jgi:hypothetical protein
LNTSDPIYKIQTWCDRKIHWEQSDQKHVFSTFIDGEHVLLRINNFPDESICSVILGEDEFDMEHLPDNWKLPNS